MTSYFTHLRFFPMKKTGSLLAFIFIFFMSISCVYGMKFIDGAWHFEESDASGHFLVITSSAPFSGEKITLFDSEGLPEFGKGKGSEQAAPYTLPTLFFSLDGIPEQLPDRREDDEEGMGTDNVLIEENKKRKDFSYAALLPLTKDLMSLALNHSPSGMVFLSPVAFPEETIFITPSTHVKKPELGHVFTYDPAVTTAYSALDKFLKERELSPFSFRPNFIEQKTDYFWKGDSFETKSLHRAFDIPEKTTHYMIHEATVTTFIMLTHTPLTLFSNRILNNYDIFKMEYMEDFLEGCFYDLIFNTEDIWETCKDIIQTHQPTPDMINEFEQAKREWDLFYRLWQKEKSLVLEESKSFLWNDDYPEVFLKNRSNGIEALLTELEKIAVPHSLKEDFSSYALRRTELAESDRPSHWDFRSGETYLSVSDAQKTLPFLLRLATESMRPVISGFLEKYPGMSGPEMISLYERFKEKYHLVTSD